MRTAAALLLAGCATAAFAPLAAAQPGTRNAIVYGARAPGETTWHFGDFALQSADTAPLTFEIGMFAYRAQGYAFAGAVYKTYIDGVVNDNLTDTCAIIDDPGNGVSPNDGRQGLFNEGSQTQKVFTNRNAGIPGSGYRISSFADNSDASSAGGISVKQPLPLFPPNDADGLITYRFNLTVSCLSPGSSRTFTIHTPLSRINSFATYNNESSNTSSENKATTTSDSITLNASWIPAPSTLALLFSLAALSARRRRLYSSYPLTPDP